MPGSVKGRIIAHTFPDRPMVLTFNSCEENAQSSKPLVSFSADNAEVGPKGTSINVDGATYTVEQFMGLLAQGAFDARIIDRETLGKVGWASRF